ncbi:MAG: haloacid dehalogenase [Armatimonadetes bacterium]|nr:haloacid dehalogenase [Armatimonadota bacterium]
MSSLGLDEISTAIRTRFDGAERARERSLTLHREAIRQSGLAIRAVHRHEYEEAERMIARVAEQMAELYAAVEGYPQLLFTGFVQDAQKEYAEASLTLALVRGRVLPSPETLRVEDATWLNGLGEAVGELRRYILDMLRHDDATPAEALLERMDEIYYVLVSMDYPDALTRGLRRTTDVARGIIEKTRGDLTNHLTVGKMERHLTALGKRLDAG